MKKYLLFGLLLTALIMAFTPDKYTLTGRVTDEQGNPLQGVAVSVKATKRGTVTDAAGSFKLSNISGKDKLIVSALGYNMLEVAVKNKKILNIVLSAANTTLDEVVVTASPSQRQTEYYGAATRGYTGDVQYSPPTFAYQLRGKASGVMIRGTASVSNGNWGTFNYSTAKDKIYGSRAMVDSSFDREGYDEIVENPFMKAKDNPLSTFSIDVDAASYSNVRRFLNADQLPPAGSVRIEEMVNYFTYDYPQPKNDDRSM
jgi:Ca-activated chloride channel homolog